MPTRRGSTRRRQLVVRAVGPVELVGAPRVPLQAVEEDRDAEEKEEVQPQEGAVRALEVAGDRCPIHTQPIVRKLMR